MALPEPEYGLVISYSYLWRHESESGQTEGSKNRPCVIVAIVLKEGSQKLITVAPVTHTPPTDPTVAIRINLRRSKKDKMVRRRVSRRGGRGVG